MSSKRSVKTPVSAKTIRTAFQSGDLDATKVVDAKGNAVNTASVLGRDGDVTRVRGRVNPAFVQAYLDANPGATYAEKSAAEGKSINLPLVSAKTGRAIKPVSVPLSEFRRLSGQTMGRPSAASLTKAAAAYTAERAK